MPFSDEELADLIQQIRNDPNYFAKTDSIVDRCTFRYIDDARLDDFAVDYLTEQEMRFSIIGKVTRRKTFLKPEGSLRLDTIFTPNEEDLTLLRRTRIKTALSVPRGAHATDVVKEDWAHYQTTLERLINSAMAPIGKPEYWSPYRKDKNVFLLTHLLLSNKDMATGGNGKTIRGPTGFKSGGLATSGELEDDLIEDPEGSDDSDLRENHEQPIEKLMNIKDWPANRTWHTIADKFHETHHINPLVAFDDEYELILPQAYEAKLLGAIAHAQFTLSRFNIRGDHVFMCNITELQVLEPPIGGAEDRKKRALEDLVQEKRRKKRR